GGVDRQHPGHALRPLGVDALQPPMRVRAAHDVRVRLPGLVDVVGVAAGAAQELRVFRALDALADAVSRGQDNNSTDRKSGSAPYFTARRRNKAGARMLQ